MYTTLPDGSTCGVGKRAKGEAIIDLKTGQHVGAAWLQVGGYILGLNSRERVSCPENVFSKGFRMLWGGVLQVPRQPISLNVRGTLVMRDALQLERAFDTLYQRARQVINGAAAFRTPGLHCRRCPLTDCAVRT